ncbi:copper-resistance protein, CopA family [Sphingomonas sp. YR710]|uniref:copper resistance system multicopper oxidase n=1 Tax=Sphingomonas sp. YR710 TaxID=1882773 RepID=UPI000886F1D1|nr:copper resistance system multicopper oxidase [Sphingomonas sp. YR710]SDD25577.1 copper-resistance protein, CopA family [Sphingomonas sp. YR710]
MPSPTLDRRSLLRSAALASGGLSLASWFPAWAQPVSGGIVRPLPTVSGTDIALRIGHQMMMVDGRESHAIAVNGTVPAPLLRLKQGTTVRLSVTNDLDEDSSIHWHGLLVPFQFDGVPGVSFPGIRPKSTFVYEFPVIQSGTYWYHSHSGLQEAMGHYGPIVIDPAGDDPIGSDREHVIVLSDHSPIHPHVIYRKLKQQPGYFNYQKQTLAGLFDGRDQKLKDRIDWGKMRMDPTDISDVTGSTYTYVVNGHGPRDNWTGLFRPGERLRLRFVNASAMTIFNVRIPGLALTIVQADGQNIRPVTVDEFQISVAETFDVIVTPADDRAYTIVGEAVDRSGMARATLAPREGMVAEVPALRTRPIATMKDMGMDMSGMAMGNTLDLSAPASAPPAGHEMSMKMRDPKNAPQVHLGPGVQTISPMPADRTGEPGQGLEDVGHKVLVYRDLIALERNPDVRAPDRAMEIHLTGNMERYMWSFDGQAFSEIKAPIPFLKDERVRITLVNDTMMSHPIHLHGHFFELVTGHGDHAPRKHTVNVLPGGTVTFDVTTDAVGDWAFHCHMMYHMHAGMMRIVSVRPRGDVA